MAVVACVLSLLVVAAVGQTLPEPGAAAVAAADPWSVVDPLPSDAGPADTATDGRADGDGEEIRATGASGGRDATARAGDRTLRRPNADTPPVLTTKRRATGHSWTRTAGALAGVVGLIGLLAWGYRALSQGQLSLVGRGRGQGLIQVISRTPLSARQSLCLVRIGPRLVLIGQSGDALRALDVIDDADLVARLSGWAASQRGNSSRQEFERCLQEQARDYGEDREVLDEWLTPPEQRVSEARRALDGVVARLKRVVAHAGP